MIPKPRKRVWLVVLICGLAPMLWDMLFGDYPSLRQVVVTVAGLVVIAAVFQWFEVGRLQKKTPPTREENHRS